MNILRASSNVADVAWNVVRSINRSLPEGRLPIPAWSDTPLKRKRERTFPPLGPRWTQSVCPKCVLEIRNGILHNGLRAHALIDETAVVDAQVLEEAGSVLLRKSCDRHGPFEDLLASDAQFFWRMEHLYPGCDYERSDTDVHGIHAVRYGRGSYVLIDLTTRCNMKCSPCFMDANHLDHVYEPDLEEIKVLLDQALSVQPKREFNILFTGGEPTISPNFIEAVEYASSIGLRRLHVATNGIRFAEDTGFARAARAAGLHGVFLQIDGMTEEKNAHRGIANYLDVKMKAIENISAAGMRVTLQVTAINGVNSDALGPIVEFAAKNSERIFGVVFQPIMFSGRDEKVDAETRYRKRYTISQLASDLQTQTEVNWEPLRDWWPMACYSVFSTLVDMLRPNRERGSVFVNSHPDSAVFSAIVVNRETGRWYPLGSFFNVDRFLTDLEDIIDFARGPALSKAQVVLSVLRNLDAAKAPNDLSLMDLYLVFQQCMLRAAESRDDHWSMQLYDRDRWAIMFIGMTWFQDLFNYELPNLHTSTAVVADAGLDPARCVSADVAFSFKNAGGWRQIAEAARHAPSLSKWHKENGRHPIYSNHQFVPIGEVRSVPKAGCSSSSSTTDAEELTDVLG
jgi:7,8-dihydro-6-hydroxymethylpterin dimethyltransferase